MTGVAESQLPVVNRGTLLVPLCLPSIACGLAAVLVSSWLFQAPSAALLTFAGSLAGLTATIYLFRRQVEAAESILRRPDLREADLSATGVFQSLLAELFDLIHIHEAESRKLADQRTRLEARAHLLRNQVRRLEQALDQLDQPVFLLDSREALIYHNESATALMAAVTGDPNLPAAAAWEHLDGLKALVSSARTRPAAADHRTAELNLKCSGETGAYRARAANLYDDDGRLGGVVALLADIREETKERGKQAEFVSAVSHELKTPLASIRAYTELLMDDDVDDPAERHELLKFIDEQVIRLTRLVNNLLNFARVESGVIKVQREDIDINRVLKKSIEVVQATAKEKNITIVEELSELYLPAHLDHDLFGQAIINLLSNAIKYTPAEGEVRLRSRMQDTEAVIDVQDNGMGIPAEALPRLFERFYRVPQNNKAAAGTGLGLALVKYIVANIHDGAIAVTSQVNKGSCFSVRVPLGHRDRGTRRVEAQCRAPQKVSATIGR
jgi:two-component system, OmpR family, phosphate regulon sensor histidine kinase PhoR